MFKNKIYKLNKFHKLLVLSAIAVFLHGCSTGEWSHDQKSTILGDCRAEGGTKKYCNCFLENIISQFPDPNEFEKIDFESAVKIAEECK